MHSCQWQQLREIVLAGATHCIICGQPFDFDAPYRSSKRPSVDHITPVELGGTDDLWNLRPVHVGCNSAKGYKAPASVTRASRDW